jgi:hypothetical protein
MESPEVGKSVDGPFSACRSSSANGDQSSLRKIELRAS